MNGISTESIVDINIELVSILEKGHSKLAKLLAKTGIYLQEVNCKEIRLKEMLLKIYQDYHIAQKQESYFKHVKDVTSDLSMIELAVDEAWNLEMTFHSSCQRAAIKCMRKNITDENLFIWICNHLACERGIAFEIQKIWQNYYTVPKKTAVDWKSSVWKSSVTSLIMEPWSIFQSYFDTYQDLLFSLMLYHVSNNLLVRFQNSNTNAD